jgi:hypothetical protein
MNLNNKHSSSSLLNRKPYPGMASIKVATDEEIALKKLQINGFPISATSNLFTLLKTFTNGLFFIDFDIPKVSK